MPSNAKTVAQYLAALPADRRAALEAVRKAILANLDSDFEEGMQYGMIGYYVPHRVHPAGYHCDPKQPLPYVGLAAQKNHLSLHLMSVYCDSELADWFHTALAKTGKKLDMGKACIRFQDAEQVALDVVGEAIRRMPAKRWIEVITAMTAARGARKPAGDKPTARKAAAKTPSTRKPLAKKPAPAKKPKKAAAKRS